MNLARRILRAAGVPPGAVRALPRSLKTEIVLQSKAMRERPLLRRARRLDGPGTTEPLAEQLVSIIIPTWNRGELLTGRTIPSVLAQTHARLELVIVGDHCTDRTAELMAAVSDPRVRFENLPERGRYPEDPVSRWMVAGTPAANRALELARGRWLAYMDDDDVLLPHHLERLLALAESQRLELVYGRFRYEASPGVWHEGGKLPFRRENVPHSAVLYRSYLRLFRYDIRCYRHGLPADADLWERMRRAGVRVGFLPEVVSLQPLRPGETGLSLNATNTVR